MRGEKNLKVILVIMFWPEVSRGENVEGKDVGVNDGLISLWCVSNATCNDESGRDSLLLNFFFLICSLKPF